jgi:membrane peptidoglycan carboxypeptidase
MFKFRRKTPSRRPPRSARNSRVTNAMRVGGYKSKISAAKSRAASKIRGRRTKDSSKKLMFFTYLSSFALFAVLGGTFLVILIFAFFSRELPDPNRLLERSSELSTKFFDRNGAQIYEAYGEKNRSLIRIDEVSDDVIHATLAAEDANFYQHMGFSLKGMLRALRNTVTGEGLQGGSTITQQVVKNALLTQDRTIPRKIKEFILSLQLENRYTKDEIIQMYLNETPYGGQSYGILTASKAYFNKLPNELSLSEAAYLSGLPQRPSYYSHFGSNPEAGLERRDYVLYLMYERGWLGEDGNRHFISEEEYEEALAEDLEFQAAMIAFEAPHFVFYVKQILSDMYGEEMIDQGGLQVTTSLDLELQQKAQDIVYDEIEKAAGMNVGNGALIALEPKTGQILSMVGSKGYFLESEPEGCISGITGEDSCTFEPNLNATLAKRQPGSAIKPITYATMLSQGYTAAYPLLDVPTVFAGEDAGKDYIPENYDGKFRGMMSLRKSLGNSLNIPAVKALKIVGIDSMVDQAKKMGISTFTDPQRYGLSLTLGGGETKLLELTDAFAVFAAGGKYRPPVAILEVKNARGDVLYKWRDTGGTEALDDSVAFLISDILSDDGARSSVFGVGSLLHISNYQVAVKTGTTDDKRDNYAIGFTPSVVAGVWVGNNNNEKMNPYVASGITGATPIWRRFMLEFLDGKEAEKFEAPKTVKKIEVDELTGMLPYDDNPKRYEWFIEGTEPTAKSSWYQKLEICKIDGLLTNDACKDADKTKVKTYTSIMAELPEWQLDVDAWVSENYNDDDKYFPPQTRSQLEFEGDGDVKEDKDPVVQFAGFSNGDAVPLRFRLRVEVSTPNDLDYVKIYIDGHEITRDESSPYGYNFEFKPADAGEHTFKAKAVDEDGRTNEKEIKLTVFGAGSST